MSSPSTGLEETKRATKPCQKFEGHTDAVGDIIHLPCGRRIMTCSDDGSLGVWNLRTGKQIANWRDGESGMNVIALSADGKKVASGSGDGVVRLWSTETGKVIAKWTGHTDEVKSVCWDGDGERVLSGSNDGTARVWDAQTGYTVLQIKAKGGYVWPAIFSPDSTLIATDGTTSENSCIEIWDAKTGKLVSTLKGHTESVYCLAWTPDGTKLISGSVDSLIRTWNTSTWQPITVLMGHTETVYRIAVSPNGRILASASQDDTARLWNLEDGRPIGLPLQHPHYVGCISFSTDGKLLATGCYDYNAYTWDIAAIIQDIGLHKLPFGPNDNEKKFLHADAATRLAPQHARQLHPGFFDDPHHADPVTRRLISSTSMSHDPQARPIFPWRVRLSFGRPQRQNDDTSESSQHHSAAAIAKTPLAHGAFRNYSAREARMKKEKEKEKARQAKNAKSMAASSSLPTKNNVMQQSVKPSKVEPSSGLKAAASTSTTSPVDASSALAAMYATPPSDAVMMKTGCWTRLGICIGCASKYNSNNHHQS